MRIMPCLPKRRNRELPRLHLSGLFRARAALAGGIRCLSVWRTLGIHNCTAERARQAARQCQLRGGGAIWVSWHGLRRNTQGRGRSRTLTPNQRDRRYVGPLRRIGGIGNRGNEDTWYRPQSSTAGARESTGASEDRSVRSRKTPASAMGDGGD